MKTQILMALGAVLVLLVAAGCTAPSNNSASPTVLSNNASLTPVPVPQLKAWVAPYCSGKNGTELDNCTYTQAFNAKDVAVCTTLDTLEERNTCITTWCASGARDFNSCYRIANNDDQLLCLSKCNPNQNK